MVLAKVASTMTCAIVNEINIFLCGKQTLAMSDNHLLVEYVVEVLGYPLHFV